MEVETQINEFGYNVTIQIVPIEVFRNCFGFWIHASVTSNSGVRRNNHSHSQIAILWDPKFFVSLTQ